MFCSLLFATQHAGEIYFILVVGAFLLLPPAVALNWYRFDIGLAHLTFWTRRRSIGEIRKGTGEQQMNKAWDDFLKQFPTASAEDMFRHVRELFHRFPKFRVGR